MNRKLKIALGVMVLFFALKWWFAAPSEVQMKAQFVEHRTEFEQLRAMFQHDAPPTVLSLGLNWVQKDSGLSLSSTRLDRYHVLMKKLGIWRIDGSKDRFRMYVFGGGFTDTSWSIGYAFSRQKPKNIVSSAYVRNYVRDTIVYSPLATDWYLYQLR